jgi:SAM-dependent methyltransferase
MKEIDQEASREYWDSNLDPKNVGTDVLPRDLDREIEFYSSDEQKFAIENMPKLDGARCLEIGGGLGTHSLWLAQQGAHVVVIDFSINRLRDLQQQARLLGLDDKVQCIRAAAEQLPLPSNAFDLVYTKSVLIHTLLRPALTESWRVLRAGGRAIFVEPRLRNPFVRLYRRFIAPKEWDSIVRYFGDEETAEVSAVFPDLITKDFYLFGFFAFVWNYKWPQLPLFKLSLALFRLIDTPLLKVPPFKKYAWFNVFVGIKKE